MRGKEKRQRDFLSYAIYDTLIDEDHIVRRLREMLDWHELASTLDDCYRHRGRPSVPPEMMLRVVIAQYLFDLSDRQMEEQMTMNMALKFFIGLAPDDRGIDHSTICRFRGRVGIARFVRLFNKIVEAARREGIISDRLHAIDSRAVKANVSTWRKRDDSEDEPPASGFVKFEGEIPDSPDPDAHWGAKSKKDFFFGYKHHIAVDADSGMIVSSVTTPGNSNDGKEMSEVLDDRAGAVVADKAYDTRRNHCILRFRRIGDQIIRKGDDNGGSNKERYVVERANAIVKRWCGGGRARYWGLEKVGVQMLLASIASNLKRWLSIGPRAPDPYADGPALVAPLGAAYAAI